MKSGKKMGKVWPEKRLSKRFIRNFHAHWCSLAAKRVDRGDELLEQVGVMRGACRDAVDFQMDRFQRSQAAHAKAKRDCALWRWLRWGLVGLLLALPGVAAAACSGAAGDIGKAGETYTLGDGTVVPCDGLLIVTEGMMRKVVVAGGGSRTFRFDSGDTYDGVLVGGSGSYDFSQIYTGRVTDLSYMLQGANGFDVDIGNWDTSNVTTLERTFDHALVFNKDIGRWDTSKVTTMEGMFSYAEVFNQDIGGWDTSNVTSLRYMFYRAYEFNADIGGWDTRKVTEMDGTFVIALKFNQDISGWDTSAVIDMDSMFDTAQAFDQDISTWNTANVQNMRRMFADASRFSQDLSGWNVCSVTSSSEFGVRAVSLPVTSYPKFGAAPDCEGGQRVIEVTGPTGAPIPSGGTLALSQVPASGQANTLVLTVKNSGVDPLALGNVFTRNLTNVTLQSFVLGSTRVPGGGSTRLTITYTPSADGALGFDLAITNNDPKSGSYLISVAWSAAKEQAQILSAASQIIGSFFASSMQSNASNRFAQAQGGAGRVFQNNLSQFQDQAGAEHAPGDAVALSTDQASATTDPSEALELIGQRLGLVDSNGWVSVTTDDLMMAATELSGFQSAAQVAQLDPSLAASLGAWDKAGSPFDGLLPGDGLDLYAAYSGGAYFKKGKEAYVGSSRDIMVGLDGFVTSELFMGLALGRETSEIKFEGTLAGKLAQQGWRADAYSAWQAFDAFNLEGLVSYAGFANRVSAFGETGTPDSQRWIASGKASLELDWDRYSVSPYGSINYSHETFDAYTTNLGTAVGKVGVEQGQWSTGLRVQGHQPIIYGLTGYAAASANGTWLNRDTVVGALPLDVLDENQLTAAWQAGLTGSLAGFAEGTWLGAVLESADASLTYGQSGIFGANRASSWSIGLAWQY